MYCWQYTGFEATWVLPCVLPLRELMHFTCLNVIPRELEFGERDVGVVGT